MSRSSNESKQLNPQKDLLPLCGGNLTKDGFEEMIAKESGVEKEDNGRSNHVSGIIPP